MMPAERATCLPERSGTDRSTWCHISGSVPGAAVVRAYVCWASRATGTQTAGGASMMPTCARTVSSSIRYHFHGRRGRSSPAASRRRTPTTSFTRKLSQPLAPARPASASLPISDRSGAGSPEQLAQDRRAVWRLTPPAGSCPSPGRKTSSTSSRLPVAATCARRKRSTASPLAPVSGHAAAPRGHEPPLQASSTASGSRHRQPLSRRNRSIRIRAPWRPMSLRWTSSISGRGLRFSSRQKLTYCLKKTGSSTRGSSAVAAEPRCALLGLHNPSPPAAYSTQRSCTKRRTESTTARRSGSTTTERMRASGVSNGLKLSRQDVLPFSARRSALWVP
mmetsp:Transcript_15577/g.37020  ORF Transcript_15577/g.37020 Transcript_15577/m.37020 type:complete len:335 (+) Transcript_15577:3125-4129(+)